MQLICPECMGTLETVDGQKARCTTHGGEFQILFSTWKPATPAPVTGSDAAPAPLAPGVMCVRHPNVSAAFACARCGAAVCSLCMLPDEAGAATCLDCYVRKPEPATSSIPAGMHCVQHPKVPATRQCKSCGAYMCETCDFVFPGNLHLCPSCAAAPKRKLSSRRKSLLIWSYVLASIATVGLALVLSGVFEEMASTPAGETAAGYLFSIIVLVPSLIGMALGFSAIDRRFSNPMSVWVATIWNVVIGVGFVVLCVVGLMAS
jgi:uncharacterized membrane protein